VGRHFKSTAKDGEMDSGIWSRMKSDFGNGFDFYRNSKTWLLLFFLIPAIFVVWYWTFGRSRTTPKASWTRKVQNERSMVTADSPSGSNLTVQITENGRLFIKPDFKWFIGRDLDSLLDIHMNFWWPFTFKILDSPHRTPQRWRLLSTFWPLVNFSR